MGKRNPHSLALLSQQQDHNHIHIPILRITLVQQETITYLSFTHNLTPRPDPHNQNELLPLALLVVGVLDSAVCERGFVVVELVSEFIESTGTGGSEGKLV